MKASVVVQQEEVVRLIAYEAGDGPEDGGPTVTVPPAVINRWQRARMELDMAEEALVGHLEGSGQW